MHRDEFDTIVAEVEESLETYTFEEILEFSDCTVEEALAHLVINGIIELPEVKIVR